VKLAEWLLVPPAIIAGLAIWGTWQAKRHAAQLAAKRIGLHPSRLIDILIEQGVEEQIAEFVWEMVGPYYGDGDIAPHPDDDLTLDANIDPEDVEDMVAEFFRRYELPQPTAQNPETIPAPLTILGLAIYLSRRRTELSLAGTK
jgi:hypothetical protein